MCPNYTEYVILLKVVTSLLLELFPQQKFKGARSPPSRPFLTFFIHMPCPPPPPFLRCKIKCPLTQPTSLIFPSTNKSNIRPRRCVHPTKFKANRRKKANKFWTACIVPRSNGFKKQQQPNSPKQNFTPHTVHASFIKYSI